MKFSFLLTIFLVFSLTILKSQDNNSDENKVKSSLTGFIRAGFYGSMDRQDDKPYVSSSFGDFGIKADLENGLNYNAFADVRFRYGTEFLEPVNRIDIREAFVNFYGKTWNVSAGQKIIKWGRADFTNPTSKLSPQDLISRSPDREDINLANLLVNAKWSPVSLFSVEVDVVPFYRSSKLLVDPVKVPFYVTINPINSLLTEKDKFSYGLKTDFHVKGADMSVSWFDGYDPMPGTALASFNLDMSGAIPVPYTRLEMKPYKIRNIGFDFETTAGALGIRGEAAYSHPYESWETKEYIPQPEFKMVVGADWSTGSWQFTAEYSGKIIPGFVPSSVKPFIGSEPDMTEIMILMSTPGFSFEDYVRQQTGAFNRLYNYQLYKTYHSGAIRIEKELFYGKVKPSLLALYNFTSRDLIITPELIYSPADGLNISLGGDYMSGKKGSLYDIADDFMNCVRVSLRVDF